MKPSWTAIISTIFIAYILNSVWTLHQLWLVPKCLSGNNCMKSYLNTHKNFTFLFLQSTTKQLSKTTDIYEIDSWTEFDFTLPFIKTLNVTVLPSVMKNGSAYIHIFLLPHDRLKKNRFQLLKDQYTTYARAELTKYKFPEDKKGPENHVISHWRTKIVIEMLTDAEELPTVGLPFELIKYIRFAPGKQFLPVMLVNSLKTKTSEFKLLSDKSNMEELTIQYNTITFGMLRVFIQLKIALETMKNFGFTEKDVDEVKAIFTDSNFYLLCATFVIAAFHLLFDFLAFKNDISFWKRRQNMFGVSINTVLWRCLSQIIIFLHLFDENTSNLILIPAFIASLIEVWKLLKAIKFKLTWTSLLPKISLGESNEAEKQCEEYEAELMRYMQFLLYPICIGGACYSLLYLRHRSYYSWIIQTFVNGVYAFGFILMLPQLFLNYKLKSVAHLPWRAFMYKAFNTFIDDVFAFLITMPTAHRIACFRDDVVFLIYLYQCWLYPVDKTRSNEFNEASCKTKDEKCSK